MNLLLFSGNSKRSGEWLAEVEHVLSPEFNKTYRHSYAHWEHNLPEIDLDTEIQRVGELEASFEPYVVFAKSAGTILTLKAMNDGVLKPKACLLAGVPLVMVQDHNLPFAEWVESANVPIKIVQNENDPFGSFSDVKNTVEAIHQENVTVEVQPGSTHDYLDFQNLLKQIKALGIESLRKEV